MAKILVVDDHPVNRQFIVKLFGYFHHTLFEAADGNAGLAQAQAVRPDLIISDIVMPEKDGATFIKELRQLPGFAKTPVIFYTASYRVPQARELADECGVQEVLHKPARPEDILRTVNGLLGIDAQQSPRPSVILDAETMRLAALVELGLDLTKERSPVGLLRKFTQALQFILRADSGGAIVLDPKGINNYAALISKSHDLTGPNDPRKAAQLIGETVKWQVSARLVKPNIDHQILGLPSPIATLLVVTVPIPDYPTHTAWLFAADKMDGAEFTPEDQRLAVTLAMQLAITFENARLHTEASLRAEELQEEIVERKRIEANLRIQTTALTSAANGVVIADHKGNCVWVNPAFTRMTGFTQQDAFGKNMRFLKSGKHAKAFYEDLWSTILAGRIWSGDMINRRKDGSLYSEEQTITPVHDKSGAITHFIAIKQDVTERKRAEEAQIERARLAALTADVGVSLSGVDSLREMLQLCAESLVRNLDAAFARVWTLNESGDTLELQASAGLYTNLDGLHSRVPVGSFKIGLIAQEKKPHLTNDVLHDPRVGDKTWAEREGMVAFAGYPLLLGDRLVGVIAMFARQVVPASTLDALGSIANQIAVGIERRRAEAERDRLLSRLRMQIDRMPLAYVLLDAECRIIDWNAAAERIFGYRKDEILGMGPPFEKLVPAAAYPQTGELLRRLRGGDMAANSINDNLTRDGRVITCQWSNTPLLDASGAFTGLISLAEDVTERNRLEARIHETQQRLQHVVSSSPAVLYTLEIDGERFFPTWISDNVVNMMGYTAEEVYRPNWWEERVHPDELEQVYAEIQQHLFTESHVVQEHRFRHKDSTYHWVHAEMRLLRDEGGKPLEVVGSWSDITERKQLEEQYRQAQKMEAIGKLAGGVAHDFNNLLTVIMGYSEIYLGKLRPEDPLRLPLSEIHKAGERAMGLTRQLLAFSRKQVLMPAVLDLNAIIGEMEKMLHRLIGEDVVLSVKAQADLWKVKADPGQMEQVVMNIIVNARDAMPQGGKLLVETKNVILDNGYAQLHAEATRGDHVLLAISDTGCGMDDSVKARVFEPFFTTKGPAKGTGLGLATVFGIVKQSSGHLEVYSEVGHGTTFKIYLPRDKSGEPLAPARTLEPARGGSETVLLVEDEDGVRTLAMTVLKEHRYSVLEARHGGDALMICETLAKPIDLLITDVVMPHFSGRQLADRLATRQPAMKVLYMSGYTDDAIVHHGVLESGMAFLQKPFAPDALLRKVREVLDARPSRPKE